MAEFTVSKRYVSFVKYSMIGSHVFETGHKEDFDTAKYNLARKLSLMIKPGEYMTFSQAKSRLMIDRVPTEKALIEGKGLGSAIKGITVKDIVDEYTLTFRVEGQRIYKF